MFVPSVVGAVAGVRPGGLELGHQADQAQHCQVVSVLFNCLMGWGIIRLFIPPPPLSLSPSMNTCHSTNFFILMHKGTLFTSLREVR